MTLIAFEGYPTTPRIVSLLEEVGISFDRIDQNRLPAELPFRRYSSPTLLLNGTILFGSHTDGESGCSLSPCLPMRPSGFFLRTSVKIIPDSVRKETSGAIGQTDRDDNGQDPHNGHEWSQKGFFCFGEAELPLRDENACIPQRSR